MKAYHSHFSIHEATNKTIVISGNFSCSTDLVNFGPNNQNQQNKDKQSWKGWIQLGTSTSEITLVLQGRSCWTLVEKPQFYNVAERWKYYSKIIFFLFSLLYVSLSFNCYYLVSMCEKIIVGPHGVPDPPSLAQMTFTQCTSMSELKIDPGAPPGGQI